LTRLERGADCLTRGSRLTVDERNHLPLLAGHPMHEELRVESEPITDANAAAATDGAALSEEEHEVTLSEERVVVNKETVPVERVRVGTETVTEQQEVTEEVAHEEIELDKDGTTRR
jgi:uncharacterized protein (TIGR02271 family)